MRSNNTGRGLHDIGVSREGERSGANKGAGPKAESAKSAHKCMSLSAYSREYRTNASYFSRASPVFFWSSKSTDASRLFSFLALLACGPGGP
jgi:hypothetical protein